MMDENNFTDTEYEVYTYLTTHDITNLTARNIADLFFVGRTTVYRVIKKMGYKTFSEFKYVNSASKKNEEHLQIGVEHLFTDISLNSLHTIETELKRSTHIFIIATSATSIASQYFSRQLANLGFFSVWIPDQHEFEERKKIMNKDDIIFAISSSGENFVLNPLLEDIPCPLISITPKNSTLEDLSMLTISFNFEDYKYENSFDRENLFPIFVIMQRILLTLKDNI